MREELWAKEPSGSTWGLHFVRKILDMIGGPVLYKAGCAEDRATVTEMISMLTNRTYSERSTQSQPCAAIYTVVYALGQSLSNPNPFNGKLGQKTSIDSRHIRH